MIRAIKQLGFTLVELMIATGIFALITSIVVYNYGDFNSQLILTNLAHEVSLSVRQAQTYGIAVRGDQGDFDQGYGINFNMDTPQSIIIFIDREPLVAPNELYDGQSEWVEMLELKNNIEITDLCVQKGNTKTCGLLDLDIAFKRPDPDAVIHANRVSNSSTNVDEYDEAFIYLSSARDQVRYVHVRSTGQISVRNPNDDI